MLATSAIRRALEAMRRRAQQDNKTEIKQKSERLTNINPLKNKRI